MRVPLPFPVTMRGRIDHCVLISLRVEADAVRDLVPRGLRLLTRPDARTGETHAFWNIVLCHLESMRPRGTPRMLGVSYHHAAIRLMVEADDSSATGRSGVQGLYFLRSDADRALICGPGNLVSDFRFHRARVERAREGVAERWTVRSRDGGGDAECVVVDEPGALAPGSPFASVEEARGFLKYRPMGLAPSAAGRRLRLAEVFRAESEWDERLVRIESARFGFLDGLGRGRPVVEVATRVAPIEYRWRLGRSIALAGA